MYILKKEERLIYEIIIFQKNKYLKKKKKLSTAIINEDYWHYLRLSFLANAKTLAFK